MRTTFNCGNYYFFIARPAHSLRKLVPLIPLVVACETRDECAGWTKVTARPRQNFHVGEKQAKASLALTRRY